MSEENVEKIRTWLKAWSRGDWDAALKDAAPDVVFDNSTTVGEWRGVHLRAGEIKRMWQLVTEPWERVEIELPGPTRSGWIWEFRDGLLLRVTVFNDHRDALEAAGVPE